MVHMDYCGQTSPGSSGAPAVTVSLTQQQRDTTVRTVVGAVDWNTRPLVRSAFIEAGCGGSLHLVIDLFAITSMDSAGLYMLLEARVKHRVSGGGHLAVITHPSSRVIPDLPSVAMRAAFDVHSTLTDASTPAPTPIPVPATDHQKQLRVRLRLPTRRSRHSTVAVFSRRSLPRWQRSDGPNAAVAAPN